MKIKTHISIIVLCLVTVLQSTAQVNPDQNEDIHISSRMINNQPTIKIIPRNPTAWFKGMRNGYEISIAEYRDSSFTDYRVIEANLRPAPEEEFRSPTLPQEYANSLRFYIYEDTFAPESESFEDMVDASQGMKLKHYFYILLSSYDPQLSEMSGLQFTLPQDISNLFKLRVKINDSQIELEKRMLVNTFYSTLQTPQLEVKPGDREISLMWNHSNYKEIFTAYRPESSTDGKHFEAMGAPKIYNRDTPAGKAGRILVKDSLSANYQARWYRLAGYDLFGILSDYTPPIKVMGRDMTAPPEPKHVQVNEGKGSGEVNVSWTAESSPDLMGFQVIASQSEQGDYQRLHKELLPPDAREFNFTFDTKIPLFYRVLSVDTASNAAASTLGYLVVYDSIPPEIPVDFEAKTDTNYVVTIKWSNSTSADVKGYRLYKAYSPKNGFVPLTGKIITDTVYYDTLADDRLDKKVYYQLVALDHHYNHSERSKYICAPVPDKVPPTPPLLMTGNLEKGRQVSLGWHKSSSDDVMTQTVLKRMPDDSTYMEIATLTPSDSSYTDREKDRGAAEFAEYYIVATDSSGNRSERSNGKRILYKQERDQLELVLQSADFEDGKIRLVWKYPGKGEYSVLVYRAEKDDGFELIGRVNEGDSYLDSSVAKGKEYKYKIGAMKSNGNRMPLSKVLSVEVE